MMRQMRENTKWIMLLTAAAFVGLMIFQWGMDASGRSSSQMSGGQIGAINGQPVSYDAFSVIYRNLYEQRQQQSDKPIDSEENHQIEDQAWNQLVNNTLLQQEIRRRGITVTANEIKEAARYSPPPELMSNEAFQTNGKFDLDKYHRFLASPAANDSLLMQLERYYRDAIPRAKLFQQIVAGAYITDDQLWRMYRDQNEKVSIRYVEIDPQALIPDNQVSVTDAEIQQYYDAHRDSLTHPARASIKLATLVKAPLPSDTAAARQRALDIRAQILGGADFADVAKRVSADSASGAKGGDLGTLHRGQTVAAFDTAAFTLPVGKISEPILSPFGFHIIQVESRKGDEAKVRHILISIVRTNDSENRLLSRADSLESLGESVGLDAAAKKLGIESRAVQLSQNTPYLPGVGSVFDATDWAFNDSTQIGDTSPVFENDQTYYMVELGSREPAGTLSLDETRDAIRNRIIEQKKTALARQTARQVIDAVNGGATLEAAATLHDLKVQDAGPFARVAYVPNLGQTNSAIGTAFGLQQPGDLSSVVEANGHFYIEQLVSHTPADHAAWEAQEKQQRDQVMAALEQSRVSQFMQDLRQRAQIVDNRSKVLTRPARAAS
jgi:peptidyl-prolyl cis-trans isomerase D